MPFVEFQLGNAYYQFAERKQSDCDTGLFDTARHHADPDSQLVDSHGRGRVSIFTHKSERYALRHYRRGGLMRHLSADQFVWFGLQRARPRREFELLKSLHSLALPCPLPYACRVHRTGMTSSGSLITQLIPDTMTLAEHLRIREVPDAQWFSIGQVIRQFHDANIYHADLNANNVLLDGQGRVYLIDFDKAAQRRPARSWKFANLKRLQRSIMKCWMQADTFYFSPASWDDLREGYTAPSITAESASR